MNLNKNKRCFWSQLLISVIAIFSLPNVQELNAKLVGEGQTAYQNQPAQFSHQEKALFLTEKAQLKQSQFIVSNQNTIKFLQIEPLFSAFYFAVLPFIRAGPVYLS